MNAGLRATRSPANTVVAHNGKRPTSERTLSGIVAPSGIRITS